VQAVTPPPDRADLEQVEDALVDGDVAYQRGTAQAAFRNANFRKVYLGTFASNIGSWMQNVVLGAYALKTTGDPGFVGLIFFAQLGPLLFLSTLGGHLSDIVDRRRYLVSLQLVQMGLSFVLAAITLPDDPSRVALVTCVFAIGIANALGAPGISAILPTLVPRPDLPGAVALASIQMNLSRVVGPVIGAIVYSQLSASPVFALNALTYLFAVIGLLGASYPRHAARDDDDHGLSRLLSGVRLAWADPFLRYVFGTLYSFSFLSLSFVGLMPVIASHNMGIDERSVQYGVLYAVFGLGAALGAVTVGTVLAPVEKIRLLRPGFVAFAALLAVFGLLRTDAPAYPVALVLGYAYFVVITSLSTVLQAHLRDEVRGRVMALWIMGFGGTVPLGVLVGGWVGEHWVSIGTVIVAGAVWSLFLALVSSPSALAARGAPRV
jgi:MFS family permease